MPSAPTKANARALTARRTRSRGTRSCSATPAAPELCELVCWLCRGTFMGAGKRENRVCSKPRCRNVRWVIYGIIHRMRTQERGEVKCRYCTDAPLPDSRYCERHACRREPCPGCGGKVRRNEGQGNHPRYCDACQRRPRARGGRDQARGFRSGELDADDFIDFDPEGVAP